jgi:NitT/TauT family transport system permease protein
VLVALLPALGYGAGALVWLLRDVSPGEWAGLLGAALMTLGRVLLATALATLWAVPAGLAIGLSPRCSRILQPLTQVLASFPAPLLFPLAVAALQAAGVPLGWGSVLLMLLAAQWYVLFNMAAGAAAVPADLREMVRSFRFTLRHRCRYLYLPAVFPQLVAGWDAAAGAAWNASMVAEAVTLRGQPLRAWGLGAEVSAATAGGDFSRLAACLVVLVLVVGLYNRQVWGRLYRLAERRFAFNR